MKLFLLMVLTCGVLNAFAQTKVTKYCEVDVGFRAVSKRRQCLLSVGVVDSLFSLKDTSYIVKLKKVNQFVTVPDLLNYMQSMGWLLAGSSFFGTSNIDFYFKKEFDSSELLMK